MPNTTTNYGFNKPLRNENVDIDVLNGNFDAIDAEIFKVNTELKAVKEDAQEIKTAASTHYFKKTNLTVQPSAWIASSYSDWPFKASITINECTADHVCDVIFNAEQISMGIFAQFAETSTGEVTIFAEEKPDAAITIPVIELRK